MNTGGVGKLSFCARPWMSDTEWVLRHDGQNASHMTSRNQSWLRGFSHWVTRSRFLG